MANRKRIVILVGFSILIISIILNGCSKDISNEEDFTDGEKIMINENYNDEYEDKYEVLLTVKNEDTLIYEIKTFNDHIIETGRPYSIEKLSDNNKWELLDLELMFTMELILIDKDNPFSQEIDISELDTGDYRISKHLMDEEGNPIENLGVIEFEILD